jgi:hypothetical protein
MKGKINDTLLSALVREIDRFPPAFPGGHMKRQIDATGSFEEGGLTFVVEDVLVGLHYAGLAVLARDMHRYLAKHPRDDATVFEQVVSLVHSEDSKQYGSGAFPNYEGLPADNLPEGLASAADAGHFVIAPLGDNTIVHEWTFKPGKRLFVKFCSKFKDTICGRDGPYEQFTKGLVGQAALPTTIASTVLTVGFSTATFWYPLAVYLSVMLVKTGLKTYCES